MFETYRMLGEQHEADLIREAEKQRRGVAVWSSGPRRERYGLRAVVAALGYFRAGRASTRGRLEVDALEDDRPPSGHRGGSTVPTR